MGSLWENKLSRTWWKRIRDSGLRWSELMAAMSFGTRSQHRQDGAGYALLFGATGQAQMGGVYRHPVCGFPVFPVTAVGVGEIWHGFCLLGKKVTDVSRAGIEKAPSGRKGPSRLGYRCGGRC